jgi:hypothetical protein
MNIKTNVHDYMTFYWTSKAVNSTIKNIGFYFDHLCFPQVVERGSIFGRYIEEWNKQSDTKPAEQPSETCKHERLLKALLKCSFVYVHNVEGWIRPTNPMPASVARELIAIKQAMEKKGNK